MSDNWHFTHVAKFRRRQGLDAFLDVAEGLAAGRFGGRAKRGGVVGTLFFEPSTRTRCSFQAAAARLGAGVCDLGSEEVTSKRKGESDEDTALNVAQYCDAMVVRHSDDMFVAKLAGPDFPCPVIDGGSGTKSHPTQALLDLLTVRQAHRRLDQLSWVICGDLHRSRTVRSLLGLLRLCEGTRVTLVAPPQLGLTAWDTEHLKDRIDFRSVPCLKEAVRGADVVYMTRLQRERKLTDAKGQETIQPVEYDRCFTLDAMTAMELASDAVVMHPGPCGPELPRECRDHERSLVLKQARNGMFVRQALLDAIMSRDQKEWWSWFGGD